MINNQMNLEELNKQINGLQHVLIAAGMEHGLGSPEALRYSEQLDELIFQYQLQNIGNFKAG
ncbi:aspartyl-phosphate phosphatase Spo0E family protein [Domibacillus sp. 8LH]|uniref:aspartyl-phosphate phosphatase Spo0E family protein n=1 Tax=Domibacillus sp. 8LH TaxID=3073900 RepID=UPI00317BC875